MVVLGSDPVVIDPAVPRETAGVEELLAQKPEAAVIAAHGLEAFFRASVALERGVRRVVLRKGSMPEAWMGEIAARALVLSGETFERGDDERYTRLRPGPRVEVAAPSFDEDVTPAARGEPLPLTAPEASLECEEVAFAMGLKPVLYLVVAAHAVERVRARYGELVTREDRLRSGGQSGERTYGVGEAVVHVFVGARANEAAELWAGDSSRNVEALGALMGYPHCCVRAFAAMVSRRINAAFPFVTAARTRALGGTFHPLLDVTTSRLVPFVPCTYSCPRAIEWAERVAAAASVTRRARTVVYFDEARAVALDRASLDGDTLSYEGPRWATEPNDRLQRAFGAVFAERGTVVARDGALTVNGVAFSRGVILPFA